MDFKELDQKLIDIQDWLKKEYSGIRTGRATVTLLDSVMVESYGAKAPLNQVATISQEDARTLKLNLFDQNQLKEVEKAITDADLGVSVNSSLSGTRVVFPELTSERREILVKQAKQKLEDAKVSLRTERDKVWNDIQEKQKASDITEDDKFRFKDEMQAKIDTVQAELEKLAEEKEKEITS